MKPDRQSLSSSTSLDATGSDSETALTESFSSTLTELESSFESLLGSLGLDTSDASARLGEFMQNLAEKLESSGPSGNLINTTA